MGTTNVSSATATAKTSAAHAVDETKKAVKGGVSAAKTEMKDAQGDDSDEGCGSSSGILSSIGGFFSSIFSGIWNVITTILCCRCCDDDPETVAEAKLKDEKEKAAKELQDKVNKAEAARIANQHWYKPWSFIGHKITVENFKE